ncbi:hypothetical protein IHE44_0009761 [Lamprotornis superbus]|uniref:Protein eva-1 C n=1 Tax=Lamprotornis superbus TaxID=245042 RepID=A0A835P2K0_9PASS|nr:hypothetical protein IHE44_0009761 [Lamprotornis superbus]
MNTDKSHPHPADQFWASEGRSPRPFEVSVVEVRSKNTRVKLLNPAPVTETMETGMIKDSSFVPEPQKKDLLDLLIFSAFTCLGDNCSFSPSKHSTTANHDICCSKNYFIEKDQVEHTWTKGKRTIIYHDSLIGYISQVLKNYTDRACDGEYVSLRCPHRTTISIQSSFYGRIVPSHQLCPSRYPHSYATLIKEDVACSVGTSLQKMLDECQDRRSCQFLVNSRLFGMDPCPGTGKYLLVWYKCRPNEYKSKVACEDDKLRLSCKKSMVIAIYSAIFGRTQGGSLECPYQNLGMPMIECQSATALQLMIKRCHGKRSCSIYASTYEFGDPCYPGIQKHLNVIYTCEKAKNVEMVFINPFICFFKAGKSGSEVNLLSGHLHTECWHPAAKLWLANQVISKPYSSTVLVENRSQNLQYKNNICLLTVMTFWSFVADIFENISFRVLLT